MNLYKSHTLVFYSALFLALSSCVIPFQVETLGFNGVLVVDAILTNEKTHHQVLLSRARAFEEDSISPEQNARVSMIENSGAIYEFEEASAGVYVSKVIFEGVIGQDYQLLITTENGESFASSVEKMPENVPIKAMSFERQTNDFGEDGVAVVLDNSSLGNLPRYFRYGYEENYKIIAPNWDPFKFVVIDSIACDGDAYEVAIEPKHSLKGKECYGQKESTNINLASTVNFDGSTVSNFLIHFINRENYMLMHRYSIMVKQFTQSADAHAFYQGLEAFSVSENVFSETQPGFLQGNIFSETGTTENVIGYFETAALSSKRIYFNYEDVFPGEPLPDYPITCSTLGNPRLVGRSYHCTDGAFGECDGSCRSPLIELIQAKLIVFAARVEPEDIFAPYYTLSKGCGDCTVLGSDIKPDFWTE